MLTDPGILDQAVTTGMQPRSIAGCFDPHGSVLSRKLHDRLDRALESGQATLIEAPGLAAGCTPVAESDFATEEAWCLLDGAIHNADRLALELGAPPHAAQSTLLVRAFARWGTSMLDRLRGEFAFVLWDPQTGRGLLARDQMGTRSMALYPENGRLWFGSDVREVLRMLPHHPGVNHSTLVHWLVMDSPPQGETLFQGISLLQPGHAIVFGDNTWHTVCYWAPKYKEPRSGSRPELVEAIRDGIRAAVSRRLDADRHTAVLLSGGLDSTSVAAMANHVQPGSVLTATAEWPLYPNVDETYFVDRLNEAIGAPHIRLSPDDGRGMVRSAAEFLQTWNLPPMGWSDSWVQCLFRAAHANGARSVLGGDGGDEVFGSRYWLIADRLRAGNARGAVRLVRRLAEAGGVPPREWQFRFLWRYGISPLLPPALARMTDLIGLDNGMRPDWLRPESLTLVDRGPRTQNLHHLEGPHWWAGLTDSIVYLPHRSGLHDHLRRRAEQAGLEARHPLYDVDLIELALELPPLSCFDAHFSRPLMRDAMAGISPDEVRLRRDKVTFDGPLVDGMLGHEMPAVRALLGSPDARLLAYARGPALRSLLEDDAPGREILPSVWAVRLWRLITAEMWLRAQEDPFSLERVLSDPTVARPSYRLRHEAGRAQRLDFSPPCARDNSD